MPQRRFVLTSVLIAVTIGLTACMSASDAGSATHSSPVGTGEETTAKPVRPEPSDPEGPAGFTVNGTVATMSGVIGSGFDTAVKNLLSAHPDLTKIVLTNAPGSDDDDANLKAALLVHEAGVSTEVLANSEIASGAVDFFLAGKQRIVADGARLGVHSWGGGDTPAAELPKDDEEHQKYLDYYRQIGIDEGFYWFTLEAASADDIHWMTADEIATYEVAT